MKFVALNVIVYSGWRLWEQLETIVVNKQQILTVLWNSSMREMTPQTLQEDRMLVETA